MKQILSLILLVSCLSCKSQQTMIFKQTPIPKPPMSDAGIATWNERQVGFSRLSQKEQEFYYWVNFSRQHPAEFYTAAVLPIVATYSQLEGKNLASLKTDLENASNLPPLALNTQLQKMAEDHAISITQKNVSPSHNSPNGDSFYSRFKKYGLRNCGGENISFGGGDMDALFLLVTLYLDIGVDDLGHRKALLNQSFTNTGIAVEFYRNGNIFLVEDFSCSQ